METNRFHIGRDEQQKCRSGQTNFLSVCIRIKKSLRKCAGYKLLKQHYPLTEGYYSLREVAKDAALVGVTRI
ncbi:MAG: hypothetical protein ABIO55_14770 [Ginsengibacter sp.]